LLHCAATSCCRCRRDTLSREKELLSLACRTVCRSVSSFNEKAPHRVLPLAQSSNFPYCVRAAAVFFLLLRIAVSLDGASAFAPVASSSA
jgi:hypothetical protein